MMELKNFEVPYLEVYNSYVLSHWNMYIHRARAEFMHKNTFAFI